MKCILATGCGGAATIGFTRSLRKSGEAMRIIGTDCNPLAMPFSKADENYLVPRASEAGYADALNGIISREKIEFLHAQPDAEVMAISKNRDKIRANTFLPSHAAVETCQDKFKSFEAWKKSDLTVPHTMLISSERDVEKAFSYIAPPLWLRAIRGAGGKGSIIAKSAEQATLWIRHWNGWGNFIASELLPNRLLTWQSIWKNGELVCAQGRERISWSMSQTSVSGVTGATGVARTVSRDDLDAIAEKAILAVDRVPNGIFGVDLKENANGVPCPTEINIGRFFTTVQFFAEAGFNMPYIYVKLAYGEKAPEIKMKKNPLPQNLLWLRSIDSEPMLINPADMSAFCKNPPDMSGLLEPDSSVKYDVR